MKKLILVLAFLCLFGASATWASDIYVAQTATGGANGASCASAYALSYLSSSGNWVAGNTYHLCGTITSAITVGRSGSSGSPITILFESGAVMTSPAWATTGAINLNGQTFVIVDGGTNGLIQNTANGTAGDPNCINGSCSSQVLSQGVYCPMNCDDDEIRNLTIANMYVHTAGSTDVTGAPNGSGGIAITHAGSNISIHNNYVHDATVCIGVNEGAFSTSNLNIYGNKTDQCNWQIQIGSAGTLNGYTVHDNEIQDSTRWYDPGDNFHHDGVFIFEVGSNLITKGLVYNNWFHGDMGKNATAKLYLSENITYTYIFNNVFDDTLQSVNHDGVIYFGYGADHTYIVNNTFVGTGTLAGESPITTIGVASNFSIENNIITGFASGNSMPGSPSALVYNYNDYYDITEAGAHWFTWGSNLYDSWASWQASGRDTPHSVYANPNLSSYVPQSSSAAIGMGANLTSLGITALNVDKNGAVRPSSGNWNAGAYQTGSGTSTGTVQAPTGLTATVN
jgi:hypothetical protein